MRHRARVRIEWESGQRRSPVPDGPHELTRRQFLVSVRTGHAYTAHPLLPHDPAGRGVEPKDDARRPGRGRGGPVDPLAAHVPQQSRLVGGLRGVERPGRGRVGRIHDQVTALSPGQREQLRPGERGGLGSAPPEQHHLAHATRPQPGQGVRRDVGARQLFRIGGQNARDVQRDIAVADDNHPFGRQIHGVLSDVRVAVVPAHDGRGGHTSGQFLPGDAEFLGRRRPDRVDHRVVPGAQLIHRDVGAHLDAELQAEPGVLVEARERLADLLRRRVVGRDTVPDEPARHGQPVDQRDARVGVQQQVLHRVHPGRSRADHRDVQRRHVTGHGPAERRRAPCVEVRSDLGLGHGVALGVVPGVELGVDRERTGKGVDRNDRVDRTGVGARAAIDATTRVDVEHLGGAELRFVRRRVDAVDRADRHARRVVAAGLGDRERHGLR